MLDAYPGPRTAFSRAHRGVATAWFPGRDDLGDGCHEEQLTKDRLHDGQRLPRVGGRHEIAVSGGRQGYEAEEQRVAQVPRAG